MSYFKARSVYFEPPLQRHFRQIGTLVFATLLWCCLAIATHPAHASEGKLALEGFDPVSYFSESGPVRGVSAHSRTSKGITYHFANAENAEAFSADIEKYTPKFGGNCAYGMVYGNKSSIDPTVWKIVDDRLYFHINPGTQMVWEKKQGHYISKAEIAWKAIEAAQ